MSKATSFKQFMQVMSVLYNNLPEDIQQKVGSETAQAIIGSPSESGDHFAQFLQNGARMSGSVYTAIVDYGLSLAAMIQLGKYDWTSGDITAELFSITGEGEWEVEYELVHLNRNASSDDALAEIKKRRLGPPKIEDLLAFGAKYPELQRSFLIVALDSVIGAGYVPCLYSRDARRGLDLGWWGGVWNARCRFLAVRNQRLVA